MAKVDFDRGSSSNLSSTSIQDGRFIYTQDTQKLYLDDSIDRVELNPNPDWNASSGNAQILNKPTIYGTYPVKGTQTSSTNAWTGNIDVDGIFDGMTIAYFLPRAGTSSGATLNLTLRDGTTTGAIEVYYSSTTRMTTHFGKGSTILLTYWSAGSVSIDGTAISTSRWTCFNYNTSSTYQVYGYGINGSVGDYGVFKGTIIMEDSSGCWQSLTTATGTGTSKVKNPSGYRLGKILYYSGAAKSSGANIDSSAGYITQFFDARNSFNSGTTLTSYMALYLVGTVNDSTGLLYLDDTWWTQTLPSTQDGKVYIYLGHSYDNYRMWLAPYHPIYEYVNGAIRLWTRDYPLMSRVSTAESSISTMQTDISGKANTSHTHTKSDITDLSNATSSVAGLMSSTDKAKLDSINITYTSSTKLITFSF